MNRKKCERLVITSAQRLGYMELKLKVILQVHFSLFSHRLVEHSA